MEGIDGERAQVGGGGLEWDARGVRGVGSGLGLVEACELEQVLHQAGQTFGLARDAVHRAVDARGHAEGAHAVQVGGALDAHERGA